MLIVVRSLTISGGQVSATERPLNVDTLRIGRGTDQDIELGDNRVALAHAEISADQPYRLVVKGTASVWVNDAPTTGKGLNIGDVIDIGRYRLTILAPEFGTDLLISVQEWVSAREEKAQRLRALKTRLTHTGMSRRRWAWLAVLLVLLPGLLVPLVLRYVVKSPTPGDTTWLPGPMSHAHANFSRDCSTCHGAPFQRVRNEACGACHAGVHQHIDDQQLLAQPDFQKLRCASCHFEHHGKNGLLMAHPAICTDCHAQPEAGIAGARVSLVSDFGISHPEFRATLPRYADGKFSTVRALPADRQWSAQTNLRYPHNKHLDPAGIDSPTGRKVLECSSCHQPDSSGRDFRPVSMVEHCASCHRLDFDPAAPSRELPHARPQEVVEIIRDFYAQRALHGGDARTYKPGELRRVPGAGEPADPANLAWAEKRARQTIDDVFDRRVCVYCHVVEKTSDPKLPWSIAPVAPQASALPHARFDHARHRTQKCESCHDAGKSSSASDVLLPGIANCRGCHGDPGSTGLVPSPCSTCHTFHMAQAQTMTPTKQEQK